MQSGSGKQVLSNMRSNQATTLGFGKRFQYDYVKRSKEQPGAGEYVKDSNDCGKQPLSRKKSMPLFSKIVKKHMVQSMHYKLNGF